MTRRWIQAALFGASLLWIACGRTAAQYVPFRGWDEASLNWDVLRWGYGSMMEDHARRVAFELNLSRRWPEDPEAIRRRQKEIRARLWRTFGLHLLSKCPLNPTINGVIDRGDYRIEKLLFTSQPGVYVTANVYVPQSNPGRHPAILCPHGHWPHGRFQPEIQARCIGLAKLGYVVLVLDAYGYGERKFTGHGEAFYLLPTGLTLEGLQIWDNMRAIDYLLTRDDVDSSRIGITGASGGGNQTMYTAALDTRIRAAVPTVSVNTFDGLFFRGIGCACEGTPGILRFSDEWDVLACIAPRPLFIPSNLLDPIFPVARAREAFFRAREVYRNLGAPDNIAIAHFYDRHSYNQEVREAMYGWFEHVFRNRPLRPVPEPVGTEPTLDFEELRVLPDGRFPDDAKSLREIAIEVAKRYALPRQFSDPEQWNRYREEVVAFLQHEVFGGFPPKEEVPLRLRVIDRTEFAGWSLQKWVFWSDWDVLIPAIFAAKPEAAGTVLLVHRRGKERAIREGWLEVANRMGLNALCFDLRGTGETEEEERLLVQNGNVTGKPALGEWTWDIVRAVDALAETGDLRRPVLVVGNGAAGLAAIFATLFDERIDGVASIATLGTYLAKDRFGVEPVYYLHRVLEGADIPQLVALCAPRRFVLAGTIWPSEDGMTLEEAKEVMEPALSAYRLQGAASELVICEKADFEEALQALIR